MPEEFQLVAGHIALDFANTLDNRYDPARTVELLPSYADFLRFARQSGVLPAAQENRLRRDVRGYDAAKAHEQVIELREALYALFSSVARGQAPPRGSLRSLNRFLAEAHVPDTVIWEKGDYLWRRADLAETPAGPLWPIVESAARLVTSDERFHIRECSADTCRWLFLDHSKNHSRRWCDMKICGNREKAQRFHARRAKVHKGI
jgi:predicted RNA-binding Zn ribbon-like protein